MRHEKEVNARGYLIRLILAYRFDLEGVAEVSQASSSDYEDEQKQREDEP